ncbi:MAG TPA: non-ribosomal peptide synthetase, partial [Methylomirabilota bacterium]|nr:non-ribosomal peptide synthetase [Methylomirabilota bacterium]
MTSDGTTPFEPFARADLEGSLVTRFARQVARHGGRLAVKMGTHALTYAELDRAANQIAHTLLARLGSSNEPVALLLPQGPRQVAAVLGALKAGKIYVPLDVAQLPRRLGEIVADSGARLIVTDSPHLGPAREAARGAHLLDLDERSRDGTHEAPDLAIAPDAGAYIFYTSGSTGAPKGVLDTHRNVLHNVMRYTNTLRFGPDDRLTLLQGPSFSGAVSSLFGALLNGAASFPFDVPREGPEAIAPWLAAEAITIYHSVPALFRHVARHGTSLPALRVIRLEGDRATVRDLELFAAHFAEPCVLVNGLGATECGLVRQFFFRPGQPLPGAVAPIGGPVEDMDVVVLGEDGRPAPPGEVGEIAVRSAYLASGYWRRPDLTARRFLPDGERPGVRMYLTGDTGRLHADGMLDYLGRQDGLAKVRGQRVEVTEVEAALLALPGVAEAAVVVREDRPDEPRVVAYLVAGAEGVPPVGTLRRALAQRLPDFMLPGAFVTLPGLPLDDNRKVDRRALPLPPAARPALDRPPVAPRNDDEATIARLWRAALGFEEVGVEDDFFELGGDSLRAAVMLADVRKATGLELGAAAFAEAPTVAAIARRVTAARRRT